jgi:hypothetical protein
VSLSNHGPALRQAQGERKYAGAVTFERTRRQTLRVLTTGLPQPPVMNADSASSWAHLMQVILPTGPPIPLGNDRAGRDNRWGFL